MFLFKTKFNKSKAAPADQDAETVENGKEIPEDSGNFKIYLALSKQY